MAQVLSSSATKVTATVILQDSMIFTFPHLSLQIAPSASSLQAYPLFESLLEVHMASVSYPHVLISLHLVLLIQTQ